MINAWRARIFVFADNKVSCAGKKIITGRFAIREGNLHGLGVVHFVVTEW